MTSTTPFSANSGSATNRILSIPYVHARAICLVALGILFVSTSFAQQSSRGVDLERFLQAQKGGSSAGSYMTSDVAPSDDIVDPATYRVGPGDVFTIQENTIDQSEKTAVVTPENILVIDRFGIVNCTGLTINNVRDSVTALMKKRGGSAEVRVTFRKSRTVYVSVRGDHPFPGTYAVPASMKISTFLRTSQNRQRLLGKAGTSDPTMEKGMEDEQPLSFMKTISSFGDASYSPYAQRNIVLRRKDGMQTFDMVGSKLPCCLAQDVNLREGDEIIIPMGVQNAATISISGAVAQNTILVWKEGDRLSTLLAAAGGPTSDADLSRVFLVQAGSSERIGIEVDSVFAIKGNDIDLQPGAAIVVERKYVSIAAQSSGVVEVSGEVRTPGGVVIVPGKTRLSEVIGKAGGITQHASLNTAFVIRPERSQDGFRTYREQAFSRFLNSNLSLEDTIRLVLDHKYKLPYVSCDFVKAFADTNSFHNVVLESGDIVVIPIRLRQVYVYGQVMNPGYVEYTPHKRLEWYIERAGGFTDEADESRSRVIKGRSKHFLDEDVEVEAGDEVYAPRPPDVPRGSELQTYAVVLGMLSSLSALAGLLYSIFRN